MRLAVFALVGAGIAGLHWARNRWNAPVADFDDVAGWTELTPGESLFHRLGPGNENNRKFVSPDGRSEAVFRPGESGDKPSLVTEPVNLGTYNFFGPRLLFGVPHAIFDVLPYFILGNTPADMLNPARLTALFKR